MRWLILATLMIFTTGSSAQTPAPNSGQPVAVDPANPSGNQLQPQGWTGPIHTQSGGAPASSPQGQTPPGMQSAPEGSDKTVKTKEGGVPVETPGTFPAAKSGISPVGTSGTAPVQSSGTSKK